MEILDFALQMEQDGFALYSTAAQSLRDKAAQRMLMNLAEDEKRHEQIIRNFQAGQTRMIEGHSFASIKNVFEELVADGRTFINDDDRLTQVLHKAVAVEIRSVALYGDLAQKAANPHAQELWRKLQSEETRHEKLLRLTLEYIDKPNLVLENAEFLFYDHDVAP